MDDEDEIKDDVDKDGKRAPRWKCTKCGKMNRAKATVCHHCGTVKP